MAASNAILLAWGILTQSWFARGQTGLGIVPEWSGGFAKRGELITSKDGTGTKYSLLGVGYCRGGPPGGKIAVGLVSYVRMNGAGAPQSDKCLEICNSFPRCVGVEFRNSDNWCEMQVPDLGRIGDGSDKTNTDWYTKNDVAKANSLTAGWNSINSVTGAPWALTTAAPQSGFYCWRKVNKCDSTPDSKCEALNRYSCLEGGRVPNTCGPCVPLHISTDGTESWHDGMTNCVPDPAVTLPTLRVSFGAPWLGGRNHDEALYLAMIYGIAKAWKDNAGENLIPIPMSKRMKFPMNITGHTEDWDNTLTSVGLKSLYGSSAPNLDQRIENHPMSGIRAMTCLKQDDFTSFYSLDEPDDAVRSRPHVVLGSTSDNSLSGLITHSNTDLPLSHAATWFETPVLGWWFKQKDFADKTLHRYYLRVNSIGMAYPNAAVKLMEHFGYKRFALITSGVSRGFIRDVKNLVSADTELMVENMDLPSACSDKVFLKACHSSIMNAMMRLKAQDARIIIHEQDGATQLDTYWASFVGLLRSDTLYVQLNALGDCSFPLLPLPDGSIGGDILWSNIYQGSCCNNKGEWDAMAVSKCTVCPNIAFQDLSVSARSNKTRIAEYNAAATQGIYTWGSICPGAPTMEAMMSCSWCDPNAAYWLAPTCQNEMTAMAKDFQGSMCIGLAKDNDVTKTDAWYNYVKSLTIADLVSVGAPKSFFDVFENPHVLFKSTGLTLGDLWSGKWESMFKERAPLMDALLLSLVAFNDWIRAAGDSTSALSSTQLRSGYRTIASTPIPNWMATLQGSSFKGLTGDVSFTDQGERKVEYVVYSASGNTLSFSPVLRLGSNGKLSVIATPTFNDGTTTPPLDREAPCKPGYSYEVKDRACVICPRGWACAGQRFPAIPCPAGQAAPEEGLTKCLECPEGTTSFNGTSCKACAQGLEAPAEAMAECVPCIGGTGWTTIPPPSDVDTRLGVVSVARCSACEVGSYAKQGEVVCTPCSQAHTTTLFRGSTSHTECVCQAGYYRDCSGDVSKCPTSGFAKGNARECKKCPDGMSCEAGSDMVHWKSGSSSLFPQTKFGYMSLSAAPLHVYECKPATNCPGGAPGFCEGGRVGVACYRCPEGFASSDGECVPCEEVYWWMLALYLLAIVTIIYILYKALDAGFHGLRSDPAEAFSMAVEMGLEMGQVIGVLTLTSIVWPDLVNAVLDLSAYLEFSVPTYCMFKDLPPFVNYLGALLTVPIAIAIAWVWCLVSKVNPMMATWSVPKVLNMSGKFISTLFVSQVTLCMLPFMCYSHPNGLDSSVLEYPIVICGDADHVGMIIVAVVGIILCVLFLAFCIYKIYHMKRIFSSPDAADQLKKIYFIIEDFRYGRGDTYVWLKLKELFLALVVVAEPDDSYIQVFLFAAILLASCIGTCRFYPWKVPFLNLLDVLLHIQILVLLCIGKDYIPFIDEGVYDNSAVYVFATFVFLALTIAVMVLVPLANRAIKGKGGDLLYIINMSAFPSEDDLSIMWSKVSKVTADDMHKAISKWQIYDCNTFMSCLAALQPSNVTKAMERVSSNLSGGHSGNMPKAPSNTSADSGPTVII
eukprot:TRINITY_DN4054_c1_g2_i1.p1 TRINITY_DN4054_c1_g2~~TRINITY_DN4054_c1_g2_i1.p1  ORF type:complete len:1579 (-),score=249.66 TRINITY_DN4054_c1_g2_i1:119-4834(-)